SKQLARLLGFQEARLAEAEETSRKALAIQKKLSADDTPEIARTLLMVATLLRREGKWAEAETHYIEGVTMWRRMQAGDGREPAGSLGYLSEVLLHQGKLAEAQARGREALAISRKLPAAGGGSLMAVIESLDILVSILLTQNKNVEAEQLLG